LQPIGAIEMSGISDLAAAGRKFSGNAQQRKRDHLLHHGTLLYRFDLGLLHRYLRMPDKQPAYRASRAHEKFVTNLPAAEQTLKALIAAEWQATRTLATFPIARTAELVVDKYSQDEWNNRR
jgi:lipoate-protein ligase A